MTVTAPQSVPSFVGAQGAATSIDRFHPSLPPYWGPVANVSGIANNLAAGQKQFMMRRRFTWLDDGAFVKLLLPTWYTTGLTDTALGGVGEWTAALSPDGQQFKQMAWGKAPTGVGAATMESFESDAVSYKYRKGDQCELRIHFNSPTGMLYRSGIQNAAGGDVFIFAASTPDLTMGGALGASTDTTNMFIPLGILGLTTQDTDGYLGDSRFAGNTIGADMTKYGPSSLTNRLAGSAGRNLGDQRGFLNMSIASDTLQAYITGGAQRAAVIGRYTTTAQVGLGINDALGARTAAQMAADLDSVVAMLPKSLKKIIWTLPPGGGSSTDLNTTVANQSPHSSTAVVTAVNAARKAIPPGFTACVDESAFFLSAVAGKWRVDGSSLQTDGSITSGSNLFTSNAGQYVFSKASEGKTILVAGAGAAAATLQSNIMTFIDPRTVLLQDNASTTVGPSASWSIDVWSPDLTHQTTNANLAAHDAGLAILPQLVR